MAHVGSTSTTPDRASSGTSTAIVPGIVLRTL